LDLADYFRVARRRGWIIAMMIIITAASAYVFSELQTPVYNAAVAVSINPARAELGLTQSAKILLRNYVAIVHSETWAQEVIERLGIDLTPTQLKADTIVASDDSRLLIQIEVHDYDPRQATRIANEWAQKLVDWRQEENAQQLKQDQVNAYQIDAAAGGRYSPKTKTNAVVGAILGVPLGVAIIFFLEWVESGVIRTTRDVERHLDLTVMGAIPPSD
jgi:capsular polysaccharide biosynthesis protein